MERLAGLKLVSVEAFYVPKDTCFVMSTVSPEYSKQRIWHGIRDTKYPESNCEVDCAYITEKMLFTIHPRGDAVKSRKVVAWGQALFGKTGILAFECEYF